MSPDVREAQVGQKVEFVDPETHERRHGHLIAAGPRFCFVWDAPSKPCVRVSTYDVDVEDADYNGLPSSIHSNEGG